jgi:predicted SnoaL-like aldol condensation-catalyzing enzyme
MSEENKQLVLRMIDEAMNKGNVAILNEVVGDDYTDHYEGIPMGPPGMSQKEAFVHLTESHKETFADLHVEVVDVAAEGDLVALREIMSGRHVGDWLQMKAEGKPFSFQVFHVFRVRDGQITDHWGTRKELHFFLQIGAVPGMLRARIQQQEGRPVAAPAGAVPPGRQSDRSRGHG